jgi:hypothetical protein
MPRPRMSYDKPQTIRLSTRDAEWLEREARRRGCARTVILSELIADGRAGYTLRRQVIAAAQREGLSLREYVSELLRAEAQRITAGGCVAEDAALEQRRTSSPRS